MLHPVILEKQFVDFQASEDLFGNESAFLRVAYVS